MKTTNYTENHNTYSGVIDIEDFSTSSPNKKRIIKYQEADNLENEITQKEEYKKKMNTYRSMTLEELKELKLVSNTNGRPSSDLTNERWQKEFTIYRMLTTPSKNKKMGGRYSRESGCWDEDRNGIYTGATNWQEYCAFINDVLSNIRSNQCDYCYYIYQIQDLLKYEPVRLCSEYCDGYWRVWLDK